MSRHDNVFFDFGAPVTDVIATGDRLHIEIANDRRVAVDHLILGTGFTIDPPVRIESGDVTGKILL